MRVEIKNVYGTWQDIKDATMTTIGKETGKEPNSEWKIRLLMAEHSPIRKLKIDWKWYDLLSWVSVHFVRHKIGIEHWVKTQRTDRTGEDRNEIKQGALVNHEAEADAQAYINISRRRLCNCASSETRQAWQKVLDETRPYEPELVSVCVKECVYRNGLCPEFMTCGYNKTTAFEKELKAYTQSLSNQINSKVNINK